MRLFSYAAVGLLAAAISTHHGASAEKGAPTQPTGEFRSGLQVGEKFGGCLAATVVAGPIEISGGCMTCTAIPASPMTIVFTQKVDENVAQLVSAIRPHVAAWGSGQGPRALLCGIGPVTDKQLLTLGQTGGVALTIPRVKEQVDKYKLNEDAAVTVIVYDRSDKVTANFAFRATDELQPAKIQEVVRSLTRSAAYAPSPKQVFVVNTQDASVSLVELATMKELSRHPVGPRPYGITVSQDGKTVAVGVEDEECVKFFSLPDFKLRGKTPIGKMFNDHMILTADGKHVLVANFYSDDVVGIDMETMKEAFRIKDCSAPHVVKYGPQRKHAFVTCKKITGIAVIDPAERKLVKFIQMNVNPRSLTFSPDEKKLYFGSFWVDGFFELDAETGKVTRLFKYDTPPESTAPQEVTYHGVEMVLPNILLAANEGRSHVDAVHVRTGKLLARLTKGVSKPCCVERIPGGSDEKCQALVSNIGDGTLQLIEITLDGKIKSLNKVEVGKAPKRVAFLP